MTNVDLRKLNRKQLLELLLEQTQRADQLEKELQLVNKKLEERSVIEKEAGSIAIAALQLNGVFDAAQQAADQYLESVKKKYENKILNKKEIINFKCEDTSKEFESVMGTIWYEKNWGWRVELKERIGCIVRKDLRDMIKELKAEEEGWNVDDICFINGVATVKKQEKTVKQTKESDIEVEINNKSKKEKSDYIDFEYRCWECGCILDEKGNCKVCGCSKEIFEI